MDKITLKNFRCFREEQTARLAPLTLLVGENSTGKTSFMALIRALWDVAFAERVPDFREAPYNLGSFRDIVHNRGGRGKPAESFEAGFEFQDYRDKRVSFNSIFAERSASSFPTTRRIDDDNAWVEASYTESGDERFRYGTSGSASSQYDSFGAQDTGNSSPLLFTFQYFRLAEIEVTARRELSRGNTVSGEAETLPTAKEMERISELLNSVRRQSRSGGTFRDVFSFPPVHSRPLRVYDPMHPQFEPGDGGLTQLSRIYYLSPDSWQILKEKLEEFGQDSGLFDQVSLKSLGGYEGAPFQVQIRKFSGKGRKGPQRNLIDVGYGVSQSLPLLSELLREDSPAMFLLQQPEVHLHPQAQAALGSLFCELASQGRQLIVETHSDHLIDRVRMDIRDKTTSLTHEDVSILYFEPGDLDVNIHSIRFDEYGNVMDAPDSYRRFFMEEVRRSIGIGL